MTLSQITVPPSIGDTIAFAGYSLYPLDRLDSLTTNGVWWILQSHPIQVTGSNPVCVGGLLSLQVARYHLAPETEIPVLRLKKRPGISRIVRAATDLLAGLLLFGAARRCALGALAAIREPIAHSPYAAEHIRDLEKVTRFARMVGRSRTDVSTAISRVREALEEQR